MLRALILTCCLMAAPAFAEDVVLTIALDRYQAGRSVRFEAPAVQDLFMAGNRVVVAAPVAGSGCGSQGGGGGRPVCCRV